MNTLKSHRHSPFRFRNGRTLQNRVVVPPMASDTADVDGYVTETTLAHYRRLAESGAGLVMVEYTYVHSSGRSEKNQLGIQSDAHVLGLSEIVYAIHAVGAVAGLQITHAGGKASRDLTGGVLMGPSDVPVPVKDQEMERPAPMREAEIGLWKDSFRDGFRRAEAAGFDLVEVHAAHGYGLNQWLSPLTNRRSDDYGGNREKNALLLLEIIREARRAHPDILLAARIPGQDFLDGGLSAEDGVWIARELEIAGIDLIDVSSGIGGCRRPRERQGEGYLVSEAERIQSSIGIPVIGVGGIVSGAFIDEALKYRRFSLAAVGRAILKEPSAWRASELSLTSA
jgi:NADPH2 dehydrogenase